MGYGYTNQARFHGGICQCYGIEKEFFTTKRMLFKCGVKCQKINMLSAGSNEQKSLKPM
uniref:Uncharacterized protein n=1 Tax=uncultured marine virus TaxID=186617 RepID=A0A0F7L411_9VIRU|nr:hypothetical protein [uncultured marine virus]